MQSFDITNIKLILCLGNIGREYTNTRHNAGFIFAKHIIGNHNLYLEKKLKSYIAKLPNKQIVSLPTTLMNLSGSAASLILNYYKIAPFEMLVVHDDLDIPLGKSKLQFAKGPYVHNGVNDIEEKLSTDQFWRLRIGVDNRTQEQREKISGRDYVLMKMSKDEIEILKASFPLI